jgi:hypothetical protein
MGFMESADHAGVAQRGNLFLRERLPEYRYVGLPFTPGAMQAVTALPPAFCAA